MTMSATLAPPRAQINSPEPPKCELSTLAPRSPSPTGCFHLLDSVLTMPASGVVVVRPDNVNTTSAFHNTIEDARGEADHLGSVPLPIAGLLIVTFGEGLFAAMKAYFYTSNRL